MREAQRERDACLALPGAGDRSAALEPSVSAEVVVIARHAVAARTGEAALRDSSRPRHPALLISARPRKREKRTKRSFDGRHAWGSVGLSRSRARSG